MPVRMLLHTELLPKQKYAQDKPIPIAPDVLIPALHSSGVDCISSRTLNSCCGHDCFPDLVAAPTTTDAATTTACVYCCFPDNTTVATRQQMLQIPPPLDCNHIVAIALCLLFIAMCHCAPAGCLLSPPVACCFGIINDCCTWIFLWHCLLRRYSCMRHYFIANVVPLSCVNFFCWRCTIIEIFLLCCCSHHRSLCSRGVRACLLSPLHAVHGWMNILSSLLHLLPMLPMGRSVGFANRYFSGLVAVTLALSCTHDCHCFLTSECYCFLCNRRLIVAAFVCLLPLVCCCHHCCRWVIFL